MHCCHNPDFCSSWWRLVTMWFLIDVCSLFFELQTSVSGRIQRACYNTAIHAGGLKSVMTSSPMLRWSHPYNLTYRSTDIPQYTNYTQDHDYMVTSCLLCYLTVIFVFCFLDLENEKLHFLSTNPVTLVDEINAFNHFLACPLFLYWPVLNTQESNPLLELNNSKTKSSVSRTSYEGMKLNSSGFAACHWNIIGVQHSRTLIEEDMMPKKRKHRNNKTSDQSNICPHFVAIFLIIMTVMPAFTLYIMICNLGIVLTWMCIFTCSSVYL